MLQEEQWGCNVASCQRSGGTVFQGCEGMNGDRRSGHEMAHRNEMSFRSDKKGLAAGRRTAHALRCAPKRPSGGGGGDRRSNRSSDDSSILAATAASLHQRLAGGDDAGGLLPVVERTRHAAAELHRHARLDQAQLGAAQRRRQHQLVHVAEVADAEDLALDAVQADAEAKVVPAGRQALRSNVLG